MAEPLGVPPAVTGILLTSADTQADWLRAGQALHRILTHAAAHWIFATLYSQPFESAPTRALIRRTLGLPGAPHLLLQFGLARTTRPIARRPAADMTIGERQVGLRLPDNGPVECVRRRSRWPADLRTSSWLSMSGLLIRARGLRIRHEGLGRRTAPTGKERAMNASQPTSGQAAMQTSSPAEISRFVVEAAVHAPSLHNTQPWWFSTGDREISVHADVERRLPVADPHGREMMISCGAALFTARVALRYLAFVPKVNVLPDPDLPNLVARIRYGAEQTLPAGYQRDLVAEDPRRRTHRGGFHPQPPPPRLITALRGGAARQPRTLLIMTDVNP